MLAFIQDVIFRITGKADVTVVTDTLRRKA